MGKKFKCKSEEQKRAIKASYARKAEQSKLVSVDIKTHKDKNGGHPHILVDEVEDNYVSVGLSTKKKKGKNATNYSLEQSPLDDGKNSYVRRQGTVDKKSNYHSPRKGAMVLKDYEQVKIYGNRAKQRYLNNKKK